MNHHTRAVGVDLDPRRPVPIPAEEMIAVAVAFSAVLRVVEADWDRQASICPDTFALVNIAKEIKVCEPQVCDKYICPSTLGDCKNGRCVPKSHWKGVRTTPVGAATGYCDAKTPTECSGIWTPGCRAKESFLNCTRRFLNARDIDGIAGE